MRVPRVFVFVDLSGFTAFTAVEGDAAAAGVLHVFRSIVRWVASRRGVRVDKWLGDGAMLVAVEPEDAVATAVELAWRVGDACAPLGLRVGIASGEALLFEGDDYVGTAVNLAARLCEEARPSEVLATTEVAAGAPPWVHVGPVQHRQPKGSPAPIELVDLWIAPPGPDAVVDPVCGLALAPGAVVAARPGPDGPMPFCSESCAQQWGSGTPGPAAPAAGPTADRTGDRR